MAVAPDLRNRTRASRLRIAVAVAVAVGIASWWALRSRDPGELAGRPPIAARPHSLDGGTSQRLTGPSKIQHGRPRRLGTDAREKLGAAISAAAASRARRAAQARETPDGADPSGTLDPRYIDRQIHELVPLIRGCYENAMERRPGLAGRLDVRFVVVGEPGVGAVVDQSEILATSTIDDTELRECVRETMYAVELEVPLNGGGMEVIFPFDLLPAAAH